MPRVLVSEVEVLDSSADFKMLHSTAVWKEPSRFYTANHRNRLGKLDNVALDALEGTLIPEEKIYPVWQDNLTEIYVKRPQLIYYDTESWVIPGLVRREVHIMEMLANNPHRNIVTYYGCIREGQYITGIGLKKYTCTLSELINGRIPEDG